MNSSLRGADADDLDRVATLLRSVADDLDHHASSVTATLRSVAWVGGVATRFGSEWTGGHRPRIDSTARYVRDAAAQLERNAAEQRQASQARPEGRRATAPRPAPGRSVPAPTSPGSGLLGGSSSAIDVPGAPALERLGSVLGALGLGRDVLDLLGDHPEVLDGTGVDDLLGVLSGEAFSVVLRGLDAAVDVGGVVVDLVVDFAEHPHLPADERIVHALADAGSRLGLDLGARCAADFLARAAAAALLPGLGAALAPFAGKAAGVVAEAVMGVIVDAVDGATDVVDRAADAAVSAYRMLGEAFGVVLDAADAAIDVADAALDLTGDVAGAVVDASGAVLGGIADAGGTVGGWLGW